MSELKEIGLDTSQPDVYSSFINTAARSGRVEEAQKWIAQAQQNGVALGQLSINVTAAISRSLSHCDIEAAEYWARLGIEEGLQLHPRIAFYFLVRFARWKDPESAIDWLEQAGADHSLWFKPSAVDFLVRLGLNSSLATGERVLERLQALDVEMRADTFRILINAALRVADLDFLERSFSQSVELGIPPSISTINSIIGVAGKTCGLQGAERWFDLASQAGIRPNGYTFHYMIQAALGAEDPDAPGRWYMRSVAAGIAPDLVTFNTLISGAAKRGLSTLAVRWFGIMKAHVTPDLITYNTLIFASAKANNFDAMVYWFKQIDAVGLKPDVVSWNTLMSACMKRGNTQWVEDLWWMMLGEDIYPDKFTLRTLRWALGRQRVSELCRKAGVDVQTALKGERSTAKFLLPGPAAPQAPYADLFQPFRDMLFRFR